MIQQEGLGEEARQAALAAAKFELMQRSFYSPEEAQQFSKQVEREKLKAAQEALRAAEGGDEEAQVDNSEKYYPLAPQQWHEHFMNLKELHVMKFQRILQSLFFLLRYKREDICARDTACLEFKKAKALINNDLFQAMAAYNPFGAREGEYREYQRLRWISNNLASYQSEGEQVEAHSVILAKILKWVQTALNLRVQDCEARRYEQHRKKTAREAAIKADGERTDKMNQALEEA
jgi:hypothetical protein